MRIAHSVQHSISFECKCGDIVSFAGGNALLARRWGALGNTLGAATLNDMSQQLVNCSAHDTRQPTPISGNARFACELSAALVIRTTACGPFLTASMCAFGSRGAAKLCGALGIGVEVRSNKSDASGTCNESANECELSYRAGTLTSRGGGEWGLSAVTGLRGTRAAARL